MKWRIAGAAAAACVMASATLPAAADVPITLNAGIGQWYMDSDRDLGDTVTPWLSLEYAFSDNWATEVFYAKDDTRYGDNGPVADLETWSVNMLYYGGSYIGESNRIRPYLLLGGGEIDIDAGAFDTVETTVNAGAGMRWMLSSRFGVRLEARMLHSLDEHHNDLLLNAGVNYYFGQVEADPVPVAAPVDSDGDGVMDDMDQCPGTAAGTRVDSVGCPMPVAKVASIKLKVNFGFDSAIVEEKYFTDISELADFLRRFDDIEVEVGGHTDNSGPESYNQTLSQNRAQAVVDLLVDTHGIGADRLRAQGYGESQPIVSNDTREGRIENRRVMATLEVEYEE